jgi:hypothetical protein
MSAQTAVPAAITTARRGLAEYHQREATITAAEPSREPEDSPHYWNGYLADALAAVLQLHPARVTAPCLLDCHGGEHLPACPLYFPAMVRTHPAVADLREAVSNYTGLLSTSPLDTGWEEQWAANHGRMACDAQRILALLDQIAGGTA